MLKKKIWANFQRIIELFTQKIVTNLSKIWVWDPGYEIRDPRSGIRRNLFRIRDPRSQIRGSKRHRIPDPDPQHCWMLCMYLQCLTKGHSTWSFIYASSLIPVLTKALICIKFICFYAIFKPAVHSGPYETPERHHRAGHLLQPYPGHSQGKNMNFVIIWAALRNRIRNSILTYPNPTLAIYAPMIYAAPFVMLLTFWAPNGTRLDAISQGPKKSWFPGSVADPGCLSQIPDPDFTHPGSRIQKQ
jgi:hypothetical protein